MYLLFSFVNSFYYEVHEQPIITTNDVLTSNYKILPKKQPRMSIKEMSKLNIKGKVTSLGKAKKKLLLQRLSLFCLGKHSLYLNQYFHSRK